MSSDNPLLELVERYGPAAGEYGPERMVRELFGAEPDDWQTEVLRAYGRGERYISIVSCHGPGKTAVLAWVIWHHQLTKYPQKSGCTAPTSQQLFDALFAEVGLWYKKLPPAVQALYNVTSSRIELIAAKDASFATFKTARAEQPEAIQGIHAPWVLLVVDEASGVPEPIFEAASGSMSGEHATTILAGNPVRTSGYFFNTHHRAKAQWWTLEVSAVERPGAYTTKRVSRSFVESMRLQYGEDSNAFRVRVLGQFPRSDTDTIIPYELVAAAEGRDIVLSRTTPEVWGLDVARFGDDSTVLCRRRGSVVPQPPRIWRQLDTMQVVGVVKAEWDACDPDRRPVDICTDVIGLGAGVVDRLRELGLPVRGINVSESPAMSDRFVNLRTELFWKAREWFTRRDCSIPVEPRDGDGERRSLVSELTSIKYKIVDSSGKLRAESKADMRKRGLKSPDLADAFVLTLASSAATALLGRAGQSWAKPIRRDIKGLV